MRQLANLDCTGPQHTLNSFVSPTKKITKKPSQHCAIDCEKDRKIIEENLEKMKVPNIIPRCSKPRILSNPATRDDVESLGKWLDSMVSRLATEKNLSMEVLFENLQLVYLGCFQELIRQVSIECVERGQLIQKIWNAYIGLFERAIIQQSKGLSTLEIDYLKENARLHKLYQKELERIKENFDKTVGEKKQTEKQLEKVNENFKYAKKKNVQLEKDCLYFRSNYENMRTEFNLIQEDNIALKCCLEKNLQNDKRNEDVEYILRKLPKREKKIGAMLIPNQRKSKMPSSADQEQNPESQQNLSKDDSFYIDEKACDTSDLLTYREKAIDTADLYVDRLPDITVNNCSSQEFTNETPFMEKSEILIMPRAKLFPRLSGLMLHEQTPQDLREEIARCLKMFGEIKDEIQDLRISMQEKENEIERLVENEGKKEQELAILSEEIQELDTLSQRLEEEKQVLQSKLTRNKTKDKKLELLPNDLKQRLSARVSQLGESIVSNVLKSTGLNQKISGRILQGRTSIFANRNQDQASGDKKENAASIPENVKEIIISKISRQTTIALKSLFLEGDGFKVDEENENSENLLDKNNEEDENEESSLGKVEESIKKNIDMELGNMLKEPKSASDLSEDESQENSIISSRQVLEIQKERNKKIDLNMLKSKRKTISMRLALLSPSKILKFLL